MRKRSERGRKPPLLRKGGHDDGLPDFYNCSYNDDSFIMRCGLSVQRVYKVCPLVSQKYMEGVKRGRLKGESWQYTSKFWRMNKNPVWLYVGWDFLFVPV